jgi:hypothetical protein
MKYPILALIVLALSSLAAPGQSMFDKVNDFDGDGRADYAVVRNENGQKTWHLWRSSAGYAGVAWGLENDTVNAGDYDGDGRTDIAVTRVANGTGSSNMWVATTYYLSSGTGAVGIAQVEANNIVGLLGIMNEDYDGDGKTDPAIFQWHAIGGITYKKSSTGTTESIGITWFQVRTGDVTGTAAADVVSTNPNSGQTTVRDPQGSQFTLQYGAPGDRFVAADFDGDNKGELTVFRASNGQWWSMRLSNFTVSVRQWGINGDIPVPADYDGDGKTDLAIYRPASPQSTYWVLGSTAGFSGFGFGIATDAPVTY